MESSQTQPYKPTTVDLNWAENVVQFIRDGGALAYPSTGLIYTLDHTHRRLTLQNPERLADPNARECHDRGVVVFRGIGWEMTVREVK